MKTIILDLGGTLAVSKDSLDDEMVTLISKLLSSYNVAIISGASWRQVHKQISGLLSIDQGLLNNLYLLPASGGSLYQSWPRYGWVAAYQHKLSTRDAERISGAFEEAIVESGFEQPQKLWGKQFENCDSKIAFSALGQKAPLEAKFQKIFNGRALKGLVSLRGINKKYGIDELMKKLHVSKDEVVYVGDSIFKGGSDYAAVEMGLNNVSVRDPEDTKTWIRNVLDGKNQVLQAKLSI